VECEADLVSCELTLHSRLHMAKPYAIFTVIGTIGYTEFEVF